MNREIKFRAWDKINNKMYPITGISFTNKDVWLQINDKQIMGANFNEIEIMQYTGLKDIHSNEVYEGDIVHCVSNIPHILINLIGKVKFLNGGWTISVNNFGNQDLYSYGVKIEKLGKIY